MTDLVGKQLGKYRLTSLLGRGGFAEVYQGEHIYLKSQAAIKVLRIVPREEEVKSFLTEAQKLVSLRHPHIVRVLDFDVENGVPFLVMEYAPHGSLRQRYPIGTRIARETIKSYVRQVADALQYAHNEKVIHRDVKPENMLLGPHDEVLLSDFGIALVAPQTGSMTTQEMAGTVPYIAPEQIKGKPRPASDQYSLGMIVYEWLSGFSSCSAQNCSRSWPGCNAVCSHTARPAARPGPHFNAACSGLAILTDRTRHARS